MDHTSTKWIFTIIPGSFKEKKDQKLTEEELCSAEERTSSCSMIITPLACSHWQTLGHDSCMRVLPVLEALKCSPPSKDNEDNAIYKSLFATLFRCPGPGCCADPLLFRPAFFQTGVAKYSVIEQWIARRSEIEYLMREAKKDRHLSAYRSSWTQLFSEAGTLSVLNSPSPIRVLHSLHLLGLRHHC